MAQDQQNREVDTLKKIVYFILLGLFGFFVYAGFVIGMPYYKYQALKSDVKDIARIPYEGTLSEKIINQVFERAQELKVPIERKDIKVTSSDRIVTVKIAWAENIDILGVYQDTLRFVINVKE
jgi:hypothetical protein